MTNPNQPTATHTELPLYHLAVRYADGRVKNLTGYPMTHAECCTMKSKFSNWSQARILFVEEI